LTLNAGAATNAVQVAGGAAAALTTITTSGDTVTVTGAVDLNARGLTVDSTAAGGSAAGRQHQLQPDHWDGAAR
jgi:hypothetical protein